MSSSTERCRHCQRELAGSNSQNAENLFCQMCMEEAHRIGEAFLYRDTDTILQFFERALDACNVLSITRSHYNYYPVSDDAFITALSDLTEERKGHSIPCEKCNRRRKGKE